MSERWDVLYRSCDGGCKGGSTLGPMPTGEWRRNTDYEGLQAQVIDLRKALMGLMSLDGSEDLGEFEATIRLLPGCDQDKAVALNAIHALVRTASPP